MSFAHTRALRVLAVSLALFAGFCQEGESLQAVVRARQQKQILQHANALAQQAVEAIQKGDLATSRQRLGEIESLARNPSFGNAVQASPAVQEARRACAQVEEAATRAATEKAAAERRAQEKASADRIAIEQKNAQRQAAQKEEEDRKAAAVVMRQRQQQERVQIPQPVQKTPQTHAHQEGNAFASSLLGNVAGAARTTSPHRVPGFQTDKPKEASLNAGTLGEAAFQASRTDEASRHVIDEAKDRKSFRIDPDTDPLFVEAGQIIANPQKALNEEFAGTQVREATHEETKVCEEAGSETLEEGEETRHVEVREPQPHQSRLHVYSHGWGGGLCRNMTTGQKLDGSTTNTYAYAANTTLYNPLPEGLRNRIKRIGFSPGYSPPGYVSLSSSGVVSIVTGSGGGWFWINHHDVLIDIILKAGEEDINEHIGDTCQNLEEKVEKGLCSYEDIIVTEGPQTRVINEYPVSREWWRRKKIYRCHYPAKNDCAALRTKGCYQVNSACKEKVKDVCVVWEQTYRCPSGRVFGKYCRSSSKTSPFCLTGNCADASWEADGDMMNAISQLSVLREVQKDLRSSQSIFKGQDRRCTRHCINFKDCCGSGGGWGVSIHLANCDKDEQELRQLRDKNRCIQVGTYCAEKKLGICIRKKTSFCCYGTKMARLIQQNGRGQLGMGFGSPQCPDCEGFTAEQLSRIDFSKIDFTELFEDIKNQMAPKDQAQSVAQVSTQRVQENMTVLTRPSLNPQAQQLRQALKEKGL